MDRPENINSLEVIFWKRDYKSNDWVNLLTNVNCLLRNAEKKSMNIIHFDFIPYSLHQFIHLNYRDTYYFELIKCVKLLTPENLPRVYNVIKNNVKVKNIIDLSIYAFAFKKGHELMIRQSDSSDDKNIFATNVMSMCYYSQKLQAQILGNVTFDIYFTSNKPMEWNIMSKYLRADSVGLFILQYIVNSSFKMLLI